MQPVNVICLKWGDRYPSDYVNRLFRGVQRHLSLPHTFHCFTEKPQGLVDGINARPLEPLVVDEHMRNDVFQKVSMMNSLTGLQGPTLFLDLDVILLNNIDELFTYKPGRFCIIHNWVPRRKTIARKRPDIGNTSVFRFEPGRCDHVLDRYLADPHDARHNYPTEQAFVTDCMTGQRDYWPDAWVRSFKRHAHRAFPLNLVAEPKIDYHAKILVFHGKPDPDEAIHGYRHKSLRKSTRPAPGLAEHWT